MRAVIQRVTQASCTVEGEVTGQIDTGFLVLLGIEDADTDDDARSEIDSPVAKPCAYPRIFSQ